LLRWAPSRFRALSGDPFPDIRRTIPELGSVSLGESQKFHGFSVDKKNVLKIDFESIRLLIQYAAKHLDMFPRNLATYEQHHTIAIANHSVDSAAHGRSSIYFFYLLIPKARLLPIPSL
jgi:hypothetical protein